MKKNLTFFSFLFKGPKQKQNKRYAAYKNNTIRKSPTNKYNEEQKNKKKMDVVYKSSRRVLLDPPSIIRMYTWHRGGKKKTGQLQGAGKSGAK